MDKFRVQSHARISSSKVCRIEILNDSLYCTIRPWLVFWSLTCRPIDIPFGWKESLKKHHMSTMPSFAHEADEVFLFLIEKANS